MSLLHWHEVISTNKKACHLVGFFVCGPCNYALRLIGLRSAYPGVKRQIRVGLSLETKAAVPEPHPAPARLARSRTRPSSVLTRDGQNGTVGAKGALNFLSLSFLGAIRIPPSARLISGLVRRFHAARANGYWSP